MFLVSFSSLFTQMEHNNVYFDTWDYKSVWTSYHMIKVINEHCPIIARPPHDPWAILSFTPGLAGCPFDPLSCGMAGCWQINSILANSGRKNSIQILNQYPFLWKILIWAQFIGFIKFLSF